MRLASEKQSHTGLVTGYTHLNLSSPVKSLDCNRWDKGYENCRLSEVPHTRLTAPAKVFDFCLDGVSKPRGRDNLLKLRVERPGCLNAIAFWFDLELDDVCTITSGTAQPVLCNRFTRKVWFQGG